MVRFPQEKDGDCTWTDGHFSEISASARDHKVLLNGGQGRTISRLPRGTACLEARSSEAMQCFMKNPGSRRWFVFLP